MAHSGDTGVGTRDRKLGADSGPGPYLFQGQDPANRVHMIDGRFPAEGELLIQGDRTY